MHDATIAASASTTPPPPSMIPNHGLTSLLSNVASNISAHQQQHHQQQQQQQQSQNTFLKPPLIPTGRTSNAQLLQLLRNVASSSSSSSCSSLPSSLNPSTSPRNSSPVVLNDSSIQQQQPQQQMSTSVSLSSTDYLSSSSSNNNNNDQTLSSNPSPNRLSLNAATPTTVANTNTTPPVANNTPMNGLNLLPDFEALLTNSNPNMNDFIYCLVQSILLNHAQARQKVKCKKEVPTTLDSTALLSFLSGTGNLNPTNNCTLDSVNSTIQLRQALESLINPTISSSGFDQTSSHSLLSSSSTSSSAGDMLDSGSLTQAFQQLTNLSSTRKPSGIGKVMSSGGVVGCAASLIPNEINNNTNNNNTPSTGNISFDLLAQLSAAAAAVAATTTPTPAPDIVSHLANLTTSDSFNSVLPTDDSLSSALQNLLFKQMLSVNTSSNAIPLHHLDRQEIFWVVLRNLLNIQI
uniref:Uncharacterized protein n=1 Tax=Trichobilharzia regenti TaxID=157069 RepID=A0AA85K5C5_TRIRE|nr:unnamed protein product [Trichobilharzia regenti]